MAKKFKGFIRFSRKRNQSSIYLNNRTLRRLKINSGYIKLHFGEKSKKLNIKIDRKLNTGEIIIPRRMSKRITIPVLKYECYFKGNNMYLGPVIGHLVSARNYKRRRLQKLRFSKYNGINGLIFIFKKRGINRYNKTIKGYYYNAKTASFTAGTFPYPSAMFIRTRMKTSTYRHFKYHIGKKIFNFPFINGSKWKFYSRMSRRKNIRNHLPKTMRYKGVDSVVRMAKKYNSVYLKPRALSRGRGILHVRKLKNGYRISNHTGYRKVVKTKKRLAAVLRNKLRKNGNYIVQQEIRFKKSRNKMDFRVYIQKDETKQWKYSGMETKVAKAGSVISNSKNRERIIPGDKAFKEVFNMNDSQAKQKKEELTRLCIRVLKGMERDGAKLGDAAVDFVMDKNRKIWLLEVQVNYASEKKAYRTKDERLVLPYILPTPFKYAKALSGF
ncbi:YheC/D like ATP-grasp [Salipaludibacillus aurantiacus]|uniref:YheC/D like ATP-grasp n=2 Tax=Salipaludibacillus aurantiacus TaxID=1601833 RepID=A0A1H9VTA7_9BACI|nr:YheC/D like ATP-grasp [Salipaludibacillus aurantiacus]